MKNSIKFGLLFCTLLLLTGRVMAQQKATLYANLLLLNGQPLDYERFWLNSRGVLAVIEGDPRSASHNPVPFRVSLRRAGKVLRQWPADSEESAYSVQLDEVWPHAQFGDELVVDPVDGASPQSVRSLEGRVLKINYVNWLAKWVKQDGC